MSEAVLLDHRTAVPHFRSPNDATKMAVSTLTKMFIRVRPRAIVNAAKKESHSPFATCV